MEFRHEYKFLISDAQAAIIKARMSGIMEPDPHVGERGSYEIRSIYFDDMYNTCYMQNEAGTDPRAKFRIRCYNGSRERITLEKKIKQNGMTRKISAPLDDVLYQLLVGEDKAGSSPVQSSDASFKADNALPDACVKGADNLPNASLISANNLPFAHDADPLIRELLVARETRLMEPKVIVVYERTPFVEPNGNVRVTIDEQISSTVAYEHFFDQNLVRRPINLKGKQLLEVKFDEFLPAYIKENLELGALSQTTFSKYYLCRRYHL